MINWEKHRKDDGSINLESAYKETHNRSPPPDVSTYLLRISLYQPIYSRQVAAVALATARSLSIFNHD